MNPIFAIDGYKLSHRKQYPANTQLVFGNFTPRSSKHFKTPVFKEPQLLWAGTQAFVSHWLVRNFNENFFHKPKNNVIREFKKLVDAYLGEGVIDVDWVSDLHDKQHLPIELRAIPEGVLVDMKTPVLTIKNTEPEFFWLPNFLETLLSAELWPVATAATTAFNYRVISEKYSEETCEDNSHVMWQCHDFAARGNMGMDANTLTGMGHLFSFRGTDSVFALARIRRDYNVIGNADYLFAGSVAATEHSVMCAGTQDGERETFHRLLTEVHPTGILAVVSDTWNYFDVLTKTLPTLKDVVMGREGKLVIRPDSGDPTEIICGFKVAARFENKAIAQEWLSNDDNELPENGEYVVQVGEQYFTYSHFNGTYFLSSEKSEAEVKGSIQLLYDLFGGTINNKGYKVLDPHIGLIYGDSITLERANTILRRLKEQGFASSNVVFGIGSYTYQYVTRDTFGFAMKATYVVVDGEGRAIQKDPATDDGLKKSMKGLITHAVVDGKWVATDEATPEQAEATELPLVYRDGVQFRQTDLERVRENVDREVEKALAALKQA